MHFAAPTLARRTSPLALALALALTACGGPSQAPSAAPAPGPSDLPPYADDAALFASLGVDLRHEVALAAAYAAAADLPRAALSAHLDASPDDALSSYETRLPHTTQPQLSRWERALLTGYLDHPGDAGRARALAVHHLWRSLLRPLPADQQGWGVGHGILALYFLHRAQDLGSDAAWIAPALQRTQAALDAVFQSGQPITSEEDHPAHRFYRATFHLNQEWNRYQAQDQLLQDFAQEPNDVYTSFVLTALNLWVGGEADADDPTTLYDFVLGSYFSLHTIDLAHRLEQASDADPAHVAPFRMAAELGGFSLLQRRWLATLHGDAQAIALIDDEHRKWDAIQPAFHAFTFGLPYFDEPAHFQEGLAAYAAGAPFCQQVPVRTCSDLPRFPFNLLGFFLGYADFLLKAGDVPDARQLLQMNQLPALQEAWSQWDIGRDAWQHRVDHAEEIAALYQRDPAQGPVNFEMKRRRWGSNTTTCQECHQTQGKPQTVADIEAPQTPPPPQIATLGAWPAVTTAWYGAAPRP